jgi:hypothetical protein
MDLYSIYVLYIQYIYISIQYISRLVEISLWKRLQTCHKTDYRMNDTIANEVYTNLKNILCFIGNSREDSIRLKMRLEEFT